MILVYLFILSLTVGYLRGGRLNGYLQKPLRGLGFPIAAFLLEAAFGWIDGFFPGEPQQWLTLAVIVEYTLLAVFLWLNRDEKMIWLMALGTVLNFCAMAFHQMRMPVSPAVYNVEALASFVSRIQSGELMEYKLVDWSAPLWWLGDTIPIPWGVPGVASIGDLFMGAGLFGWTQTAMLRNKEKR
ncbi:MAG: DUF5317 domain-containing protein [Eubacteriales bacterium]|nr:DUF5317 domain-containing protein [Eubacteriales bacterium]